MCLIFLGTVGSTLLVMLMIVMIDIALLGCVRNACTPSLHCSRVWHWPRRSLYYFDIRLNSISVGTPCRSSLSLDPLAHIGCRQ